MCQPVFHGWTRPLVFFAASLFGIAASAADYYAPPEYVTPSGTTIIHAGMLLAVPGDSPASNQSIIVQNGLVVADLIYSPSHDSLSVKLTL